MSLRGARSATKQSHKKALWLMITSEYYSKLRAISENKKWDNWIEFFLRAIVAQAKANSAKAKAILELYGIKKHKLSELTHSQYVIKVLDTMFARPLFSTTDFIKNSKIPKESAIRLLRLLKREKMLTTLREGKGRSPELLIFNKLFDIVQ